MSEIKYRTADVDGFKVSYREAGSSGAPKLLLLHGFPSAGHMFRDLIPLLADRFHIVAPDLPGFGQSDMPARDKFAYTFDNIAAVIDLVQNRHPEEEVALGRGREGREGDERGRRRRRTRTGGVNPRRRTRTGGVPRRRSILPTLRAPERAGDAVPPHAPEPR